MYNNNFNSLEIFKCLLLCKFIRIADLKKTYKSKLSNSLIKNLLIKSNTDNSIIKFTSKSYNFKGKFTYYTNKYDLESMVYFNSKEENLYIIFNGTEFEFSRDFVQDAITFLKLNQDQIDKSIWVHSGYYNILFKDNVINKIFKQIEKYSYKNLFVIGHSAGGGLANIFGYLLSQKYPDIKFYLNTFAPVKVGNKKFVKYLGKSDNIQITTLINSHDLIPILPPIKSYSILDNIIRIIDNKIIMDTDINLKNNYSINDHFVDRYIYYIFVYIKKNN